MNSNEKIKPVGKKARKKEPTIEELLTEEDLSSPKKVDNTSVLYKFKDI